MKEVLLEGTGEEVKVYSFHNNCTGWVDEGIMVPVYRKKWFLWCNVTRPFRAEEWLDSRNSLPYRVSSTIKVVKRSGVTVSPTSYKILIYLSQYKRTLEDKIWHTRNSSHLSHKNHVSSIKIYGVTYLLSMLEIRPSLISIKIRIKRENVYCILLVRSKICK